ncbi:MotE family protein [Caldanaerobius polysaccharolyticus]|uniref:MotE family protein n=1 Tax=Caldanaerobius polysaccharolyticus TaxID=44256 RepID=UPI00047D4AD1|nr:hypothetical protein [Caldanaerobius polysaccharolyticus]
MRKRFFPFFLILAVAAGVVVYFNFFNIKDAVIKQLSSIPVVKNVVVSYSLSSTQEKIAKEMDYIRSEKLKLQQRENQLNAKEADIKTQQEKLMKLQKSLDDREKLLNSKEVQIKDLVKYYENMDPQSAASILEKMQDSNQVALILKNMQKSSAAQIMQNMNPDTAAKITQIMMGQVIQ